MPVDTDFLTEKKGPLPVWAWAGLGIVGAIIYRTYSNKKTASTATTQSQNTAQNGAAPDTNPPAVVVIPGTTSAPTTPPSHGRTTSGGTTLNSIAPGGTSTATAPYTVTGSGDTNQSEIVMKLYGVPASDVTDIAVQSALIDTLNPNVAVPYVKGQVLTVPAIQADGKLFTKSYPASS